MWQSLLPRRGGRLQTFSIGVARAVFQLVLRVALGTRYLVGQLGLAGAGHNTQRLGPFFSLLPRRSFLALAPSLKNGPLTVGLSGQILLINPTPTNQQGKPFNILNFHWDETVHLTEMALAGSVRGA